MAETLLLAKVGLQINAGIIGPEQLPFQEMLESKFQTAMQLFQVLRNVGVFIKRTIMLEVYDGPNYRATFRKLKGSFSNSKWSLKRSSKLL